MTVQRKLREAELHRELARHYRDEREGSANGAYYVANWNSRILSHLPALSDAAALDVGCGLGTLSQALEELGGLRRYVGTDLSGSMLAAAAQLHHGASFCLMDAETLAFSEASFDVVIAKSVLHHVPDPKNAAAEIVRVTRPGGYIVVAEPRLNAMTRMPRAVLRRLSDRFDPQHAHFTAGQLTGFFAGFDLERVALEPFGFLAYPLAFPDILRPTGLVPHPLFRLLFRLDLVLGAVPLLRNLSWHLTVAWRRRS